MSVAPYDIQEIINTDFPGSKMFTMDGKLIDSMDDITPGDDGTIKLRVMTHLPVDGSSGTYFNASSGGIIDVVIKISDISAPIKQ